MSLGCSCQNEESHERASYNAATVAKAARSHATSEQAGAHEATANASRAAHEFRAILEQMVHDVTYRVATDDGTRLGEEMTAGCSVAVALRPGSHEAAKSA